MEQNYKITGMHCASCVHKLEAVLRPIEGVSKVNVSLNPPVARLEMVQPIPVELLRKAVEAVGSYSISKLEDGEAPKSATEGGENLKPLFIIVAYLIGAVLVRAVISQEFSIHTLMVNFMGGFFIIFSLFKMIDLSGFATGYATYDLLAARSRAYALTYPFIELGLGIAYFTLAELKYVNLFTFILMGLGALGVASALRENRKIQCACLGTALKLPMTKVTLIEDIGMGLMAVIMLVW